jgi:hypothetical protein
MSILKELVVSKLVYCSDLFVVPVGHVISLPAYVLDNQHACARLVNDRIVVDYCAMIPPLFNIVRLGQTKPAKIFREYFVA